MITKRHKVRFQTSIIFLLLCLNLYAQEDSTPSVRWGIMKKYYADHGNALVDKFKQEAWIKKTIQAQNESALNEMEITPSINDYPGYEKISYRFSESGIIHCENRDKIIICIHSAHTNPEIGDISLAWFKNKNKLYINYGHICGGIINFMSTKAKVPKNAKDFFRRFYSDTDDKNWTQHKVPDRD